MSERPSQQQIAAAIVRVHKALREAWPSQADELTSSFENVSPRQFFEMATRWGKGRELWIKNVQDTVEKLPLAESAETLEGAADDLIAAFEESANDFRVGMMETLDD